MSGQGAERALPEESACPPAEVLVVGGAAGTPERLVAALASAGHRAHSAPDAPHARVELGRRRADGVIALAGGAALHAGELAASVRELQPRACLLVHEGLAGIDASSPRGRLSARDDERSIVIRLEHALATSREEDCANLHRAARRLLESTSWDACARAAVEEARAVLAPCVPRLEAARRTDDGVTWAAPVCDEPEVSLAIDWPAHVRGPRLEVLAATFADDVRLALQAATLRSRLEEQVAALEAERTRRAALETRIVRAERVTIAGTLVAGVVRGATDPLAAVLVNLALLPSHLDGSSVARAMLEDATAGAARLRDVLRQIGVFGDPDLSDPIVWDLRDTLRAVARVAHAAARTAGELSLSLAEPLRVRGFPAHLAQAFLELFANALQAASTERPSVHVHGEVVASSIVVRVRDEGRGIAPALVDRVFEPYFSTRRDAGARGLGLSIAAETVHAHGGTIELESTPEAGTEARVTLPRASAPHELPAQPKPIAGRPRVLVVDDDAATLRTFARVLRGEADVTTASPEDAVRLLIGERAWFDVVVCDYLMPGMSGDALWELLRTERPSIVPSLVICSGAVHDPGLHEFVEHAGLPLLEKPFAPDEIRAILRRRTGRDEAEPTA